MIDQCVNIVWLTEDLQRSARRCDFGAGEQRAVVSRMLTSGRSLPPTTRLNSEVEILRSTDDVLWRS